MTFPGLEMTILKCHDLSRFSMTVRTVIKVKSLISVIRLVASKQLSNKTDQLQIKSHDRGHFLSRSVLYIVVGRNRKCPWSVINKEHYFHVRDIEALIEHVL